MTQVSSEKFQKEADLWGKWADLKKPPLIGAVNTSGREVHEARRRWTQLGSLKARQLLVARKIPNSL